MRQHPNFAVLYGDFSVAGSGPPRREPPRAENYHSGPEWGGSSEAFEMSSRRVIWEDLERTTREVVSEDRAAVALAMLCEHDGRGSRLAVRSEGRPDRLVY